jgi:hypothetical protein
MSSPSLVRGANAPLRSGAGAPSRVRIEVSWRGSTSPATTLTAVACDARGQALGPEYQVTVERPSVVGDRYRFEMLMALDETPESVVSVSFALGLPDVSVRSLTEVVATVQTEAGEPLARYQVEQIPDASCLLVAEVYRRSGQWKVRALGQGFAEGRSALLRSVGLAG